MYQYKTLLNQVGEITKRYEKINELTGENFNVFRILKLDSSEVRMHSAFIAELLDPKGKHGQKEMFLKIFTELFCFKDNAFDPANCEVEVEKHVGYISEDEKAGGRIDILITDRNKNSIIIENKVFAKDGRYQLLRYHNHSKHADILYLSLDGKEPSDSSKSYLITGENYKCISYEKDIIRWLELCRKEVSTLPIIREGITHYINLLKYLTNQSPYKSMQNEISELISKNLRESFLIHDNLNNACDIISKQFGIELIAACQKRGLACEYSINFNNKHSSIWIWEPAWEYLSMGFGFQAYDKGMRYGFLIENPETSPIPNDIKMQITNLANNESNQYDLWWPWFNSMEEPLNNWSKYAAWQAILDGRMQENIFKKIDLLLEMTSGLKM